MNKISIFLTILTSLIVFNSEAQYLVYPKYYCIKFTDKNNSQYSIAEPNKFLSQKAIDRRKKYQISITTQDLPVSKFYLDSLKVLGFKIHNYSKWLNTAIVEIPDSNQLLIINSLSFVEKTKKNNSNQRQSSTNNNTTKPKVKPEKSENKDIFDYGKGSNQIKMLNGHFLHNRGYRGEGITIAVLDAGFYKVNSLPAFDSLWVNNQILGWYDFVDNDTSLFDSDTHGMQVLSCIAANMPGQFIGTAPKANFYLFRTEQSKSEYMIEEFNWLAAAELADSVGCDMIHSSLGYNDFDDNINTYTYADMNGNTAISTIAADIAASKGILVVTSAGNEGNDPWKYMSAPADADSILAVGAVDKNGTYASFSSQGPTFDGRIKPDCVGQGLFTTVQGATGKITTSNGTSFSGPVIAGMVACLWQAHPSANNMQIINAVQKCSNKYNAPDQYLGYGIPDFNLAHFYLAGIGLNLNKPAQMNVFPNPFIDNLNIGFCLDNQSNNSFNISIELFDVLGRKVYNNLINDWSNLIGFSTINNISDLAKGVYILKLCTNNIVLSERVVKN